MKKTNIVLAIAMATALLLLAVVVNVWNKEHKMSKGKADGMEETETEYLETEGAGNTGKTPAIENGSILSQKEDSSMAEDGTEASFVQESGTAVETEAVGNGLQEDGRPDNGGAADAAVNDESAAQEKKEKIDKEYSTYVGSFNPTVTQMEKGISLVLIGDNMQAFKEAIAGYYYQMSGNAYNITKIRLDSIEGDDENETRGMVTAFSKVGEEEYSQDLLVIWDKAYKFYSVYAYRKYSS